MNDVTFEKTSGNLGIVPISKDHYSGILVYEDSKPSGFSETNIKVINSLAAAEDLGVTSDATSDVVKALHYHLKRFFAVFEFYGVAPQLWVMIADVPESTYDFAELESLQDEAVGSIRNFGIYLTTAFATTTLDAVQAKLTALENNHRPSSAIVAMDYTGVDWSTIDDIRGLTDPKCHANIGEDGGKEGKALADTLSTSLTDLGSILGVASVKQVHENIAHVERFNVAFDGEFDVPALADGALVSESEDVLESLNTKGFIFMKKHIDYSGTYFNDSHAATAKISDYAYMENNQVIDKAIRGIRVRILPNLNASLDFDDEGKLDIVTIADFEGKAKAVLEEMKRLGEVSRVPDDAVYIDPGQDVVGTEQLLINVKVYIKGIARNILVKIGLAK